MDPHALMELETGFWEAAGDGDYYRANMAEDGLMIFPGMGVLDKYETISAAEQSPPWDSYDIATPRFVTLSDIAVSMTYVGSARRGMDDYRAAITSVYADREGAWKLVLHQQTPL